MGLDIDPSKMEHINPYVVLIFVSTIVGLMGAGIAWSASKGMTAYIRFSEHRAKMRIVRRKEIADDQALQAEKDKQKKLIDKLLESTLTTDGLRALLRIFEQRIQELESKGGQQDHLISELYTQLNDCNQKHAGEQASNNGLRQLIAQQQETMEQMCERTTMLEEQNKSITDKLKRYDPKADPNPSPGYHIKFDDKQNDRDQGGT